MLDYIHNSICKDCKFRISRVISSEGLEIEDLEELSGEEYIIDLYHEYCIKLHLELDHIVLACSPYESKYTAANYFFVNSCVIDLTKDK